MFALILAAVLSIADFGAKPDGSLCTAAFERAIEACSDKGGGRVEIPAGTWFTGAIRLRSNIELHIDDRATVRFSDELKDLLQDVPTTFEGVQCIGCGSLIYAYACTNVAVTGGGTFTTEQKRWRERQLKEMRPRPHFLQFNRCKGVRLDGFKLRYAPAFWFCEFFLSEDIVCRNLDIFGMFGNSDAFDFESSRHGLVENCRVDNGDDAFCVKSGRDEAGRLLNVPSEDIEFRNCHVVRSGCFFVIGSEISGGARNIRVHDCTAEVVREAFVLRSAATRGGHVENVKMWNCSIDRCESWFVNTRSGWPVDSQKIPSDRICWTTYDGITVENVHVGDCGKLMNVVGPDEKPYHGLAMRKLSADQVRFATNRIENVDASCRIEPIKVLGKTLPERPHADANELVARTDFDYAKVAAELPRTTILVFREEPEGMPDRHLHWERLQNLRRNGYELNVIRTFGPGVHEVTDLRLGNGDTLVLEKGARLVASTNCTKAAVWAKDAVRVTICGEGTIDGNGAAHNRLRAREPYLDLEPARWSTVLLKNCRDVRIEGVEMLGASGWTCHLDDCVCVTVRGVRIFAHANFNNDGIDVASSDVLLEDCDIDSEDDALVFKTKTPSKRVENVRVRNCRLSSDSSYIKVGTESWGTFRDICVESCELSCRTPIRVRNDYRDYAGVETRQTGISAMEVSVVDGGNLDGVVFRNLIIGPGVITPLFVRLAARHPAQKGRATFLRNVLVENVRMTSPTTSHIASSISGECGLRPSSVTLRNCEFLFKGGIAPSQVTPIVENPTGYPSPWGAFRSALPAYGLFIRRADDVKLESVSLRAANPREARPPKVVENAVMTFCD